MKISTTVLILLILPILLFAEKINIAVNDLSGQNVDSSTMVILSDRVRSELIKTQAFTVVERNEMGAILQEQGFMLSGVCDESTCLIEIGKMLGVERMVAGTIGKLNDQFYTVSLRMIDVASGEIILAANHDHNGDISQLLSKGVEQTVHLLVQSAGIEIQEAKYRGKTGELYISSPTIGASIIIDGKETDLQTPALFEKYPAGSHEIMLVKDAHVGRQEIVLEPDELLKVSIDMTKARTSLLLKSDPLGAEVVINGTHYGTTPLQIDPISAGYHNMELRLEGYSTFKKVLSLKPISLEKREFTLTKATFLSIQTKPDNATLFMNDKEIGVSPYVRHDAPAGKYTLRIEKEMYDDLEKEVDLSGKDSLFMHEDLIYSYGMIDIDANSGAEIFFNGSSVGTTSWKSDTIVPGSHELKVTLSDYSPFIKQVTVDKGETFSETITLELSPEFLSNQKKKRQNGRRVVFGIFSASALVTGIIFDQKMKDAQQEYYAYDGDSEKTHQDNYDKVKQYQVTRNILYGTSGAFALGFVLSIPF